MKLSKTQWIVVAVIGIVAIWYFFLRNKNNKNNKEESGLLGDPLIPVGPLTCPAGQCKCKGSGHHWICDSSGEVCCERAGAIVRPVGTPTRTQTKM